VVGTPRQKPRLYILLSDVVTLHLTIRLADFGQHSFLVCDVELHCVRNEKVRAWAGSSRELCEAPLNLRFKPDAEGCTSGVCHKPLATTCF